MIHFRWALWVIGFVGFSCYHFSLFEDLRVKLVAYCDLHFRKVLTSIVVIFFILAWIGKYSQFWTLNLHGQDFWLFVDLLEQAKKGGIFLTRFAPQSLGFVQHGVVHPMFSWLVLVPFAWLFSSVTVALVFNPLVLAGAGWMIGILAKEKLGSIAGLLLAIAFLSSTQVGKILMYEVHPEAAYPFLTLLVLWSMGLNSSKTVRWGILILSTALCAGLKEDSFLILFPWIGWGLWNLREKQRLAAIVCGLIAVSIFVIQMISVQFWLNGRWGPEFWEGQKVLTTAGVGLFQGVHWSGISSLFEILEKLLAAKGGLNGSIWSVLTFFVSRPFLSLLVFAPWIILRGQFWIVLGPLIIAYSLLDSPRTLWNYYSAPFLGSFWFCILTYAMRVETSRSSAEIALWPIQRASDWFQRREKKYFIVWTIMTSLFLGRNNIDFFLPTEQVREIRKEVQDLVPHLKGNGLVASSLLGLVPLDFVLTDRLPDLTASSLKIQAKAVDFVLYSPVLNSFEFTKSDIQKLEMKLSQVPSLTKNQYLRYKRISPVPNSGPN